MIARRMDRFSKRSLVALGLVALSGCQGSMNRLSSLGQLHQPSRVPAPPAGALQAPAGYGMPGGAGGTTAKGPAPTTLGSLRALERGQEDRSVSMVDGRAEAHVTDASWTGKPVVRPSVDAELARGQLYDGASAAADAFVPRQASQVVPASTR